MRLSMHTTHTPDVNTAREHASEGLIHTLNMGLRDRYSSLAPLLLPLPHCLPPPRKRRKRRKRRRRREDLVLNYDGLNAAAAEDLCYSLAAHGEKMGRQTCTTLTAARTRGRTVSSFPDHPSGTWAPSETEVASLLLLLPPPLPLLFLPVIVWRRRR